MNSQRYDDEIEAFYENETDGTSSYPWIQTRFTSPTIFGSGRTSGDKVGKGCSLEYEAAWLSFKKIVENIGVESVREGTILFRIWGVRKGLALRAFNETIHSQNGDMLGV